MSFATITDRSDPAVQRIADVMKKAARAGAKTTFLEDVEPITQAIRSGVKMLEVYALQAHGLPDELAISCEARSIPVRLVDSGVANQIFTSEKKPKVFAVARMPAPATFADIANKFGDIVVLDGVKIVGNIGAIVRTAYAMGASGVVLVDSGLTTVIDRRVVRASRGYVFSLPVILANRDETAEFLASANLPVAALDARGDTPLDQLGDITERIAIAMGAEKTGGSDDLASAITHTVSIPMNLAAESLNVSVAAGMTLYARAHRNLD